MSDTTTVLIVGAGFAGLGTAIRLLQQGIDDFVVLERADEVGGTWRDNTYPGAACDIPSLLYSYGFEQNPDWSRAYSGSAEILGYIKTMVDKYSLSRFIRFGVNVTGLEFDEESALWTAQTADGSQFTARTAVMASGPLANASLPDIRGLDTFDGHKIHSARWDHDYDMSDKRVAVIGTGASAVQIIPELVKTARSVKVFQRTPRLGPPSARLLPSAVGAHGVSSSASRAESRTAGVVLGARAHGRRHGLGYPPGHHRHPAGGEGEFTEAGIGYLAQAPADAELPRRLQTDADEQRLLPPRSSTRQLQAHLMADRDPVAEWHTDRRWHRTRSGLHRLCHRLRCMQGRHAFSHLRSWS